METTLTHNGIGVYLGFTDGPGTEPDRIAEIVHIGGGVVKLRFDEDDEKVLTYHASIIRDGLRDGTIVTPCCRCRQSLQEMECPASALSSTSGRWMTTTRIP